MLVDRNAAPIIGNRDRAAIVVQRHRDVRGIAVHRLVDRVVEDFPNEMMKSRRTNAADVHAGAFSNRFETFEDSNVFSGI